MGEWKIGLCSTVVFIQRVSFRFTRKRYAILRRNLLSDILEYSVIITILKIAYLHFIQLGLEIQ